MDPDMTSPFDRLPKAIASYPTPIKLKLFAIKYLLNQKMKYSNDFQNETTELLKKYHEQVDQLIMKSDNLIKGEEIPELEGTPNLQLYFHQHEIAKAAEINLSSKPFEKYWYEVIMNSNVRAAVHPEEEEILKDLEELTLSSNITKREKKFKITFKFRENEYFTNDTIICSIKYDNDDNLIEAKTNKIYWYPHQNINNILAKHDKTAGGFFKLFKRFDISSQNAQLVKYKIDINFIASELIHEIIPHSFHYYLGVVNLDEPKNKPFGNTQSNYNGDDDIIIIEERKE